MTRRQAAQAGLAQATLQRLTDRSVLDRVAHGVYRLAGAPEPDHPGLRAAWLQLAPEVPVWERVPEQGIVSHRSAAAHYRLGHLPADRHEFTLPARRQSRRPDVRLHQGLVEPGVWTELHGLPVTRPARISSDLLADGEDPAAVGHVVADAIRQSLESSSSFVEALAPHATRLGLRRYDGLAMMRWLLDLVGDPDTA